MSIMLIIIALLAIILLPGIIECIRWQIVKYKDKRSLKK
jgi:hypothetical protein